MWGISICALESIRMGISATFSFRLIGKRLLTIGFLFLLFQTALFADTIEYTDTPRSFPGLEKALGDVFGTASFPPLIETPFTYYQVDGHGPVEITFTFLHDGGDFHFDFGFYRFVEEIGNMDVSTDEGRTAFAREALRPGNAVSVFRDDTDDPGVKRTFTVQGGDTLGFFLVPDAALIEFQKDPGKFAIEGSASRSFGWKGPYRWPLFSFPDANPQGMDQMMGFSGFSRVFQKPLCIFAWEDLTRAEFSGNLCPSDRSFEDLVFSVEGVAAVGQPEASPGK